MNINILMCNYFQSVGKEKLSMKISIIRGFLLNIILVMIMPVILGGSSLWLVVPMTEIITFIGMYVYIIKVNNLNYKLCNE
jgi:Na+-driven multidrug efflux pump